ncbi:YbaB/EbfC family nucleoid-associated protein [Amycolatopsis sp. GM8]|uniref:YbaB/EbfC family nucleoid-associated protein n=1 Tax=Amycolatopsis sp. GM8 TaxID=2896530 RepID=UPI001F3978DA|nr:YbaB/EbfC family nucleoid-associated protein [Amycolatopsis sp. GM8]
MSPEEWLANFESRVADVRAKAAEFQENLQAAGATESSKDGSIAVTVAPNGALTDLRLPDTKLAQEILRLARKAQRAAAVHVAEAFAPLGADSEAMEMVTGYIPPEEPEPPEEPSAPTYRFTDTVEPQAPPPRPIQQPAQQPQSRPRRTRPSRDEDEDFGDNSYLRRD